MSLQYWPITGPAGATGATGAPGATGATGAPGSVWYNGAGIPAGVSGVVGDYYIDNSTLNYYQKTGVTTWNRLGNLGGTIGTVWYNGTGAPANGLGVIGDYYIDNANGNYYTKTGAITWNLVGTFAGGGGGTGPFGLAITVPPTGGWTWDNQNGATIASSTYGEYLSTPKSGSLQVTMRYRTAPATPYTVTANILHDLTGAPPGTAGSINEYGVWIGFRDGTGKIIQFLYPFVNGSGPGATVNKFNTSTSFNGSYANYQNNSGSSGSLDFFRQIVAMRIGDDGTTLTFQWSIDGATWKTFFSVGRTNFMAAGPTQIGFGTYANGGAVEMALMTWIEA